MLKRLTIQNYAIIEEIEIRFSERLNIITGETGAGKSILMGALSLILGDRADTSALLNRDRKCVVEGSFAVQGKKEILSFLSQNDLDDLEEELVLRREIAVNGKSRAFINDTPVNLEQLRELSTMLVDLHRQFDTRELGESHFQREVLDALAGPPHASLLLHYQTIYRQWQHSHKEWRELVEQKQQFDREYDYNRFLFDELEEAALQENELENAEAELKLMSNAEGIKNLLTAIIFQLEEGEAPLYQQLKSMVNQLQPYAGHHPALPALIERLGSVQSELRDVAGDLGNINDHVQYDAARVQWLDDRLSLGYKLLKKHGVQDTTALLRIRDELQEKLQFILHIDDAIASKEKVLEQLKGEAADLAGKISAGRLAQVKPLEQSVNKLLTQVGMPNARFRVELTTLEELSPEGRDSIEFLFDANKSNRFEPLRKVASGGELSRLMLCIKSLVAESLDLPTLIFDEIDTGISGEAARQVGLIMKKLAVRRQVISITHQPQIAGKADAHFFVFKEAQGKAIRTGIRLLDMDERITAIARMLSGEKPTAAALENAREMLMN